MSGLDPSRYIAGFLSELHEHAEATTRHLVTITNASANGEASPRALRDIFRALHTIKGLAAMVGFEPIVDIAHAMEALVRAADAAGGRLSPGALDALVAGLRAIEQRGRAIAEEQPVAPAPPALLASLTEARALTAGAAAQAPEDQVTLPDDLAEKLSASEREQLRLGLRAGRQALRVDFVPSPARVAEGVTIAVVRERLERLGEIVKIVPLSALADARSPGGVRFAVVLLTDARPSEVAAAAAAPEETVQSLHLAAPPEEPLLHAMDLDEGAATGVVRVHVARLDDALDKLSALVVTRFRLERAVGELARQGVDVRALWPVLQENGRQLRDLRTAIMRARMIKTEEMLERVPLVVRGLTRQTGKEVRLHIEAGQSELDKAVGERIFPAILHLVRNAVDHAVESASERQAAGKPALALVRIACHERSSNQLELRVEDDGRGIDAEAVARRAGREVPRTEQELLNLITLPGISTRGEATTTSGRGMGMDIVKRIVDELGGELVLSTARGRGTSFALRIPLTITIVDAFAFRCGPQVFVVPVSGVEEIVEIDPARISRAPSGKGRAELRMLERHGMAMPLIGLDSVFRLQRQAHGVPKAIVVRRNGQPFAFEVDQMMRQQEVVVRPVDDPLVRSPGVVGATDLGDGQPTLVLDLVALSARLSRRRSDAALQVAS